MRALAAPADGLWRTALAVSVASPHTAIQELEETRHAVERIGPVSPTAVSAECGYAVVQIVQTISAAMARFPSFPTVAALWVVLLACGCMDQRSISSEVDDLVGGSADGAEAFPATLLMVDNCTVSKVGPRHVLTAAHCVYDKYAGDVRDGYRAGDIVSITEARALGPEGPTESDVRFVTIEATVIHPEWMTGEPGPDYFAPVSPPHAPDVAVIILDAESAERLADIPEASVDPTPVADGDEVWIMGYGCEEGIAMADAYPSGTSRLKVHRTVAQGASTLNHRGSHLLPEWEKPCHAAYSITPGQSQDPDEASLCPGDSGGPVYRADGTNLSVVGVNGYYSFLPPQEDPKYISYTNWHTRLDRDGRWGIGRWLTARGVNVSPAAQEDTTP